MGSLVSKISGHYSQRESFRNTEPARFSWGISENGRVGRACPDKLLHPRRCSFYCEHTNICCSFLNSFPTSAPSHTLLSPHQRHLLSRLVNNVGPRHGMTPKHWETRGPAQSHTWGFKKHLQPYPLCQPWLWTHLQTKWSIHMEVSQPNYSNPSHRQRWNKRQEMCKKPTFLKLETGCGLSLRRERRAQGRSDPAGKSLQKQHPRTIQGN